MSDSNSTAETDGAPEKSAPSSRRDDDHPAAIQFEGVTVTIGGRTVLSELSLEVPRGEIMVLLGRSGSGKTTTLRLVNRMIEPAAGKVRVEGRPVLEWEAIELRRRIGYAIQDSGLLPHFTVARNVGLVPELQGRPPQEIAGRVEEMLRMVGLPPEDFQSRFPGELSGGQRQRVGLARALAANPVLLLLDEPFGALDPITRAELQREFRRLQRRVHKTALFVTHDVAEAMLLGDRIALLDSGRLHGVYAADQFMATNDSDALVKQFLDALPIVNSRDPGARMETGGAPPEEER
jgi:osmoprotectant transport system ATP-binding protein